MLMHRVDDEFRRGILIHTVSHQHKDIALFHRQRLIVNFKLRVHAQSTAEIGCILGNPDLMIVGQLFQRFVTQAIDA